MKVERKAIMRERARARTHARTRTHTRARERAHAHARAHARTHKLTRTRVWAADARTRRRGARARTHAHAADGVEAVGGDDGVGEVVAEDHGQPGQALSRQRELQRRLGQEQHRLWRGVHSNWS